MSGTKLSRDAYDRLNAELHKLTTEGRIKVANAIESARALGDLKENGEYHQAKDDQGKMEARIRQIQEMMTDVEIVEDAPKSDNVIEGSVVEIRYVGDSDTESYLIGSIEERRDDVAVMSPASPLGSALLGHRAGETVSYDAPNGELSVEIVAIR